MSGLCGITSRWGAERGGEGWQEMGWVSKGGERRPGKRIRRNVSVWLVTLKLEGMTEWSRYSSRII